MTWDCIGDMFNVFIYLSHFERTLRQRQVVTGMFSALGLCSELADQEDCDSDDGENNHDHPDDTVIIDIQDNMAFLISKITFFSLQKVGSEDHFSQDPLKVIKADGASTPLSPTYMYLMPNRR